MIIEKYNPDAGFLEAGFAAFGGRIIYEGFIVPYPMASGPGARKMFSEYMTW
ncbi:MAG: hypothetical protein WAP91_00990 [Bacilli bacterium]